MPSGLCRCGCGGTPRIATRNDQYGNRAGKPRQFINGHQRRLSAVEYLEQDCGYESPCWVWQRGKSAEGYGRIHQRWGSPQGAHRVYYERSNGPIPEGFQLDHLCRNPSCVNPDHLEPVSPAENTHRGRLTRLTQQQVDAIRASGESQARLALRYGVDRSQVSRIKNYKRWAEVA